VDKRLYVSAASAREYGNLSRLDQQTENEKYAYGGDTELDMMDYYIYKSKSDVSDRVMMDTLWIRRR